MNHRHGMPSEASGCRHNEVEFGHGRLGPCDNELPDDCCKKARHSFLAARSQPSSRHVLLSRLCSCLLALFATCGAGTGLAADRLAAFPGAEGFGATTPGGRGGRVLFVTNLGDYHPAKEEPIQGSLRLACTTPGRRIVVFSVSGTIMLKDKLVITEPFITIAGQSAPGDGICLRNCSMAIGDAENPVRDVIVRYLRVRPGPDGPQHYNDVDAISVEHANNVIIDHCSLSWDVDETLTIKGAWWNTHGKEYYQETHDVTVQYCILSESLNRSRHQAHVKPPAIGKHSKTLMIDAGANRISIHHNLLAHGDMRNPLFPCEMDDPIIVDYVNNVVYNFGTRAGDAHKKTNRHVDLNFVGNYYFMGPDSAKIPSLTLSVDTRVFASGNIGPLRTSLDQDEYVGIVWNGPQQREGLKAAERFDIAPPVTTHPCDEAHRLILVGAGASLPKRDAIDRRIIDEVDNRTGRIIDHPDEVGGWPHLQSSPAPTDADQDGMPDDWETRHGLNPAEVWDNARDRDGDGYTNIEEWLNGTDSGRPEGKG